MKTKSFLTTILFALLVAPVFLQAQSIKVVRETPAFQSIKAGGILTVYFTQADAYSVELEAEERVMNQLSTQVKNGELDLVISGNLRNADRIVARITAPELQSIKLSGASSFTANGLVKSPEMHISASGATSVTLTVETENLQSRISGASSLNISGLATNHNATVGGASQLRAAELETQVSEIKASGASSAKVWAREFLSADASGTSRISYDQAPTQQTTKISGVSSITGHVSNSVSNIEPSGYTGDTLRLRLGNRDLWIMDEGKGKSSRTRRQKSRKNWAGFELGINGFMTPEQSTSLGPDAEFLDLRYNKSIAVNLNLYQQNFNLIKNNLILYTGAGLSYNNYRFDNQIRLVHEREGINWYEDSINNIRKGKLTLTYVNVPLMLEYQTHGGRSSEKFHIAGGINLGTRIGTHTKYVYNKNGKKNKDKSYEDFHINPFRVDAVARMGWSNINLFATYSLNPMFKDGKGPEIHPFSIGISVVNW